MAIFEEGIHEESMKPYGWFEIKHLDSNGNLIEERKIKNLIVNVGMFYVAGLMDGSITTDVSAMGIGTGTTAAAATDTSLETLVMSLQTGTLSLVTTSVTDDTYQQVNTFNFTASYAITEAGIFSTTTTTSYTTAPPTLGTTTMIAHQVFAAINVSSGDSLQITWKIQIS